MTHYKHYLFLSLIWIASAAITACGDKNVGQSTNGTTGNATSNGVYLKVAYVEVDSLLSQYNLSIDLNESMVKKQENVRLTLNQKAKELENAKADFQKKYENHAFASQESAQKQYNALIKKEQDLQELGNKLQAGLLEEAAKNNQQLRDSINTFLRRYNKEKGYTLIFSKSGMDNLLYADSTFNITNEVVEGLNARYTATKSEKKE